MKIVQVSAISTGIVIILGIALILPGFIRTNPPLPTMLSFNIVDDNNLPEWCDNLSNILKKYNIKATVFITGKVADEYPNCVRSFPNNVEVGSQTYDYISLPSIPDYSAQLAEVKNGKLAVDRAGNLDSKIFRSPYGATDKNIYSLLSRSNIIADFSYNNQYNTYSNGKFIRNDLIEYNGAQHSSAFFSNLSINKPVLIDFDNSTPIEQIDRFVSELKSKNIHFLSATEMITNQLFVSGSN